MANKGVNYKRYKQAGWVLVVMTVAGTVAGLAVMHPTEQEECIPRGYGRQRIESPVRPLINRMEADTTKAPASQHA